MKRIFIFFALVFLEAICNYYSLGLALAIAYSAKPNAWMLNVVKVFNYILWLPLGLLGHTKHGMLLEWNYPVMVLVNAFIVVGIIYFIIFSIKGGS
jgi:hypothetical protein